MTTETRAFIIDLTPGPTEMENLLDYFSQAIIDDCRKSRREDSRHILRSIVDLAFTLGYNAGTPEQAIELRKRIEDRIAPDR